MTTVDYTESAAEAKEKRDAGLHNLLAGIPFGVATVFNVRIVPHLGRIIE